jgi:hypothetical protein
MFESDIEIIRFYKLGWHGMTMPPTNSLILQRAYKIGELDFIVGDELESVDFQTEEQILNSIKNG